MADVDARITRKINTVAKRQNVLPAAIEDLHARAARGEFAILGGKVRHVTSGSGVKRFIEAQRDTRPEIFAGPPIPAIDNQNPWSLPPGPEGDAKRAQFVRAKGTRESVKLASALGKDLAGRPLRARP